MAIVFLFGNSRKTFLYIIMEIIFIWCSFELVGSEMKHNKCRLVGLIIKLCDFDGIFIHFMFSASKLFIFLCGTGSGIILIPSKLFKTNTTDYLDLVFSVVPVLINKHHTSAYVYQVFSILSGKWQSCTSFVTPRGNDLICGVIVNSNILKT